MRKPATKSKPAQTRAAAPVVARPHFPLWLMVTLLVLVTIALYWPAMRCDFINLDDPEFISGNPHVQGGLTWEGVKWAFHDTERAGDWVPLLWLSHMLVWQLVGANPWGHHLINVLLHAANTALVFLVFRRMTGATWRSLLLAALFGWHPLRVESVAWVTERKDVLSTLFWMLGLLAYAKYSEATQAGNSKQKVWYGAALAMFVLGLMSKAMLVTMPFVLLLLDYWPLGRFKFYGVWRLVKEKIPFFALAMAASVLTFMAQKQGGAVIDVEKLTLGARLGNALISYCRYLGKTFWPMDLAVYYPHPGHWPLEEILLASVLLCGISMLLFVKRRQYPFFLMGWLWFLGTLVPVIGLVQVSGQAMADRYTYIPSLGVLILTIWGAYELVKDWRYQKIASSAAGSAAIVLCIGLTRHQLEYWTDSEALFRHTLKVTKDVPNNYLPHKALGDALLNKGQIDGAISQYQEAIRLKPDDVRARSNLGAALFNGGQIDAAVNQFQEAIRLKPDYPDAHNNLGFILLYQGHTDEAISQFQEAIRLNPDFADAHYNVGLALDLEGKFDEAINQYQEAIRLKPGYIAAQNSLTKALELKNRSRPPDGS